jgi:hypothetical protein
MDVSRRRMLTGIAGVGAALVGATRWALRSKGDQDAAVASPPTTTAAPPEVASPSTATTVTTPATTPTTTTEPAEPEPEPIRIEVIGREGWGAKPPTGPYVPHTPARITVHHTQAVLEDNRQAPARFRQHQRLHQVDRSWPDLAYHLMIDRGGNVYQGRPLDVRGDTATTYDPTGHLLPCLEGDFNLQDPTEAQIDTLVTVIAWMMATYEITPDLVAGHRDFADTSCPGDRVYPLLGDVTDRASELRSERIELTVIEGEDALVRVAEITA